MRDWLHLHDRTRSHKVALTAKSYFLQEAEGLSRQAKVAWAMRRGDARVTNLQHDGIVVELPEGMEAGDVQRGMSAVRQTRRCRPPTLGGERMVVPWCRAWPFGRWCAAWCAECAVCAHVRTRTLTPHCTNTDWQWGCGG